MAGSTAIGYVGRRQLEYERLAERRKLVLGVGGCLVSQELDRHQVPVVQARRLRFYVGIFARYGFGWAGLEDGLRVPCRGNEFPDAFHTDRACSARVRARLDEAARRLH